jgi:hypothetical protein
MNIEGKLTHFNFQLQGRLQPFDFDGRVAHPSVFGLAKSADLESTHRKVAR